MFTAIQTSLNSLHRHNDNDTTESPHHRLLFALLLIIPLFGHTEEGHSDAGHAEDSHPDEKAEQKVATLDQIVAIVDSDVITRTELDARVQMIIQQIEKQGTKLPPHDILEKQVLERIISDRLQLEYAAQTGIRVDDNQLDKTLERIADQNKLSLPDFKLALDKEGINFDKFREDIRKEIIIARLREREVDSKVSVTEAEIDNALTTQNSGQDSNDEYEVAHIMVRVPGTVIAGRDTKTAGEDRRCPDQTAEWYRFRASLCRHVRRTESTGRR